MENAFRARGGLASAEDVVRWLGEAVDQPISCLARWIVGHDVISFQWQGHTMLPLFQFDLPQSRPHEAASAVARELLPVLGEWDACLWFAQPNVWLDDAAPVEVIGRDPRAVLDAARAHRYLVSA
jgi:hypothetical protein